MAIAFAPIDIDVKLPDETILLEYIEKYKVVGSTWDIGPVLSRMQDDEWRDMPTALNALYNRYNTANDTYRYANGIDELMPEIPYMLNQLPFKKLTVVVLFKQTAQVNHHYDPHTSDIYEDPSEIAIDMEPRRYNILLTKHDTPSFFLGDTMDEKIYPRITRERPAFAFCERYHYHGADYIGPGKVMLSVFGILDREKHKEFIEAGINKYPNEVIRFTDPNDPTDHKYQFKEKYPPY